MCVCVERADVSASAARVAAAVQFASVATIHLVSVAVLHVRRPDAVRACVVAATRLAS